MESPDRTNLLDQTTSQSGFREPERTEPALILWGMLFGYLFFDEVIGPLTMAGAVIIIGAGLFIFLREQRLRRQAR